MNSSFHPPGGDRRRFWIIAFALFLGQAGLIFLLGRPSAPPADPTAAPIIFRLVRRPVSQDDLAGLLAQDPTVLVFPNPHGFSGGAWMAVVPQKYDLPDWTEPPRWLEAEPSRLGKTFVDFVHQQESGSFHIAGKGPPPAGTLELLPPVELARTQSVWRVEGALARRAVITPFQPRSWEQNELLKNSSVEIAADSAGTVVSARLISRSGRPEADQSALASARSLRFAPLPYLPGTPTLTWGTILVQWCSLPVPSTNRPAAKPQ